jgi:hypothetical protein
MKPNTTATKGTTNPNDAVAANGILHHLRRREERLHRGRGVWRKLLSRLRNLFVPPQIRLMRTYLRHRGPYG